MKPDLSISIVDTNNCAQTIDCLRSIYDSRPHSSVELFVVDNACTDGSADRIAAEFPQVTLIRNSERKGFSTNNNLALARASGRYLMLLNDDTVVPEGVLDKLVSFMDTHLDAGVVGPKLLRPNGAQEPAFSDTPRPFSEAFRPVSEWLSRPPSQKAEFFKVDSVCGAAMVVRREVFETVGGLDTDFDPIYSEEVDWCYRIKKAGWEVYHLTTGSIFHLQSQTMNKVPAHKVVLLMGKKALFFRKHGARITVWEFKIALFVAALIKMGLLLVAYPFNRSKLGQRIYLQWRIARVALFL